MGERLAIRESPESGARLAPGQEPPGGDSRAGGGNLVSRWSSEVGVASEAVARLAYASKLSPEPATAARSEPEGDGASRGSRAPASRASAGQCWCHWAAAAYLPASAAVPSSLP